MINTENLHIYLATRKPEEASHLEGNLVLDGFDVSSFPSAKALWDGFQQKPARLIITNRQFGDGFSGLDLARKVREHYLLPYVYIVVLSAMNRRQKSKRVWRGAWTTICSSRTIPCNSARGFSWACGAELH